MRDCVVLVMYLVSFACTRQQCPAMVHVGCLAYMQGLGLLCCTYTSSAAYPYLACMLTPKQQA